MLGERQGREVFDRSGRNVDPPNLGTSGEDNVGGSSDTDSRDDSSRRWVSGIGIGASWEADVWGRVRSKKAAAEADSAALEADYFYARQSLAAAVARAYVSTIEASQQAANARETLGLYEDYYNLTDIRKGQGFASDFEMAQIGARTAGARDAIHTPRRQRGRNRSGRSK